MNKKCIYMQVLIQLYLKDWNYKNLSQETGISYTSLCRKLAGESPLSINEAKKIQKALNCGLPIDKLFEMRETA